MPVVYADDEEFLEYKVDQFLSDPKEHDKLIFNILQSYQPGTTEYKELYALWKELIKK